MPIGLNALLTNVLDLTGKAHLFLSELATDASERSLDAVFEMKDASERSSDAFIETKDVSEQSLDVFIKVKDSTDLAIRYFEFVGIL